MTPLPREFYARSALTVARELLGKTLWHGNCAGIIVETEAYIGPVDRACHAFGGRRTARTEPLFGEAGHAYIYFTYGMYHCLNAVAGHVDAPECALIRALMPIEGLEEMRQRRPGKPDVDLCRGPGKLCMALGIDRALNTRDLTEGDFVITEGIEVPEESIVTAKRVGIEKSGEAADYPWRFYVRDNLCVSRK